MTDARHPDTALTAYVTGALSPAERAEVTAHLEGCAECLASGSSWVNLRMCQSCVQIG